MNPTEEQQAAVDLFATGESMVIEAGAGTGKTSTLKLVAEHGDVRHLRGQYLAFNKAIVTDVAGKLPQSCSARTAHSVAYGAVGHKFKHRLNSPRMKSTLVARFLGLEPLQVSYGKDRKVLAPGYLASATLQAVVQFCQTADDKPSKRHFRYIDGIDVPVDGKRTYAANDQVRAYLEPYLAKVWADIQNTNGQLPFTHGHYLKLWQLSHPRLPVDYVLFDEAQDADPVMAAVVAEQEHAQRVYVGDAQQAIYEWRGAVNAMDGFASEHRRFLTQSFRFGPAIADRANDLLEELDAPIRLKGLDTIGSTVGDLEGRDPAAVLCRTNALAVTTVIEYQTRGKRPFLVGGGGEVVRFAKAARELQQDGKTYHPELACFDSWGEVVTYTKEDPSGSDLKLMVDLIEQFGVSAIVKALDGIGREDDADVVVSTAHKAKGREWESVLIGSDFAAGKRERTDASIRLEYVAVTRAREHLDCSALEDPSLSDVPEDRPGAEYLRAAGLA